jgi:hypothetical protein
MVERHSWAVQQVAGVGVQTVEDARLTLGALWTPAGQITSRSGVMPTGTAAAPGSVLATSPTPNGFVHVQPFRAVVQSSRSGGTYILCLDAIKDIDILGAGGAAADPSNPRRDLIIAQQSDTYIGGDVNSDMVVKRVGGTPAGSPVDPTVTGSADYIVLARVTVTAGATSITTGNITQLATQLTVATGGLLPVADATERGAIANPYDGMQIYRRDTDWIEAYDGTAWRAPALCRTTALANITSPFTGQFALLTTDNALYRWSGSAWVSDLPRGTVGYSTTTSATGVTTSDLIQPETVTVPNLVTGRRYRITHTRNEAGSSNVLTNRYRFQAGASLVLGSSTQINSFNTDPPGSFRTTSRVLTWVSTITGQATFGLSSFVNTGTASGDVARQRELLVEDIGL